MKIQVVFELDEQEIKTAKKLAALTRKDGNANPGDSWQQIFRELMLSQAMKTVEAEIEQYEFFAKASHFEG